MPWQRCSFLPVLYKERLSTGQGRAFLAWSIGCVSPGYFGVSTSALQRGVVSEVMKIRGLQCTL
jgi:hypothetical protein